MSSRPNHTPPPYRVTIGAGTAINVDPSLLDDDGIRLDQVRGNQFVLHANGRTIPMVIEARDHKHIVISSRNRTFVAHVQDHRDQMLSELGMGDASNQAPPELPSPMPGLVLSISVEVGQHVAIGDPLLVLEAMKMENQIKSSADWVVAAIRVEPGMAVQKGQILIEFEPKDS